MDAGGQVSQFIAKLWNEPVFFLGVLAAAADGVLVLGVDLPLWATVPVHVVQLVATRALVSPAKASS